MSFEQLLELLALVSIIVLPALAITMRIALKPVVEAVLRLSESFKDSRQRELAKSDDTAVRRLSDELEEVRGQVRALEESDAFYKKLLQPPPSENAPDSKSTQS